MKIVKTLGILFLLAVAVPTQAQTVDEIIDNYIENTGGADAWNSLKSMKMVASANAQGMEIPVEILSTKDGKQMIKINFQGQEIVQLAYDGETMWTTNFMTMQAEKSDAEATENMKRRSEGEFPMAFLDYKKKGFTAELMGSETKEGTDTFKVKLTQTPTMVDGAEVPNVTFYYFEKENFVPIATETEITEGPAKGQMSTSTMSDYQEVDGLYFPFDMGMQGQTITIKEIVINPEIDNAVFAFPAAAAADDKD